MIPVSYIAVVLVACTVLTAETTENQQDSRLDGTWRVIATEMEGRLLGEGFNGSVFVIERESLTWTINEKTMRRRLRIDRSTKPAQLDQIIKRSESEEKSVLGIYRFENEKLVICRADAGCERPSGFRTKQGDCNVTLTLRRISPAPSAPTPTN